MVALRDHDEAARRVCAGRSQDCKFRPQRRQCRQQQRLAQRTDAGGAAKGDVDRLCAIAENLQAEFDVLRIVAARPAYQADRPFVFRLGTQCDHATRYDALDEALTCMMAKPPALSLMTIHSDNSGGSPQVGSISRRMSARPVQTFTR